MLRVILCGKSAFISWLHVASPQPTRIRIQKEKVEDVKKVLFFSSGFLACFWSFYIRPHRPKRTLRIRTHRAVSMVFNFMYETSAIRSVAHPDPGSGAFLIPGSGIRIRDGKKSKSGIRDEHPESY